MNPIMKLAAATLGATAMVAAAAAPASAVTKPASVQDCPFKVFSDYGTFCFPRANGAAIHVEHVYQVCAYVDTWYAWELNPGQPDQYKYQRATDLCDSYRNVPGNTTVVAYWN